MGKTVSATVVGLIRTWKKEMLNIFFISALVTRQRAVLSSTKRNTSKIEEVEEFEEVQKFNGNGFFLQSFLCLHWYVPVHIV